MIVELSKPLILASASPRRRELFAQLNVPFDVVPSPLDEPGDKPADIGAEAWAQALAHFKARAVADQYPDHWVLGADTLVSCDGRILGKPRDEGDARAMLELQARTHADVITGLCLLLAGPGPERFTDSDVTRVWMRDDVDEREAYLRSGDWQGKAGAYGIQNCGDRLVDRIEGSFTNVVGLPLELLERMLRRIAAAPCADVEGR